MKRKRKQQSLRTTTRVLAATLIVTSLGVVSTKATAQSSTSYAPVAGKEDFQKTMARMKAAKADVMEREMKLLRQRYDLSDRARRQFQCRVGSRCKRAFA